MALNDTNFAAAMKELYPDKKLHDLTLKEGPFLAMCPKYTNAKGKTITQPLVYGNPQGVSAAIATAITNKGNSLVTEFSLTWTRYYSIASIDKLTSEVTDTKEGAFLPATKVEVDGALNSAARSLAKAMYKTTGGSLGVVGSISTTTLTLSDINDITNFDGGMELVGDTVDGGGTVHTGSATVTGLDEDAGTLTSDSNWTAQISSLAADDYLFREGDYDAMLAGLKTWIPATAPTDTLFGVARTSYPTFLGGYRLDGTGLSLEDAFLGILSKVGRGGGKPDCIYTNQVQYRNLIKSIGSKVQYVKTGVNADVFFSGVAIEGGPVTATVYQDFNCDATLAYALQKDTWTLWSSGPAPKIFDLDTDQFQLREATADAYEIRTGYYAQLGTSAPKYNGVVQLPAAT